MTDFEYAEKFLKQVPYRWAHTTYGNHPRHNKKQWCRVVNDKHISTCWVAADHDMVSRELWQFLQREGAPDAGNISTLRRVMAACKVIGGAK